MKSMERLFQALGDETRLRILGLLLTGEVCVCDIHDSLGISQPKASRHLAYLRRSGLVDSRRDGLWVHYRLADAPDPVVGTVYESVRHALAHVTTVQRDAKKLQGRTGTCLPVVATPPAVTCCAPTVRKRARTT